MTRSALNGFSRAFTEDDLRARRRHHEFLALHVRPGLDDQLERPDQRDQFAGKAVRLARQRQREGAVVVRLRRLQRDRADVLDVPGPLSARVPEKPHLGRLRRVVDLPADAAFDPVARLEDALAADVDPKRAHAGLTVTSNDSSTSGHRLISPFTVMVQTILLLFELNECIVFTGTRMVPLPRSIVIGSAASARTSEWNWCVSVR